MDGLSQLMQLAGRRIIDAHIHLWNRKDLPVVLNEARRLGLYRVCASSLLDWDWSLEGDHGAGNAMVFEAARRYDELLGYVYLDPTSGEKALREIEKYLDHRGMIGVKLWIACPANDKRVEPIAEAAHREDLVMLVHAWRRGSHLSKGYQTLPIQVAELATSFPGVTIIMAHMGGDWESGLREVSEQENVLVDTCGSINETGMIELAVDLLGPERVVYGSDAPGSGFLPNLGKIASSKVDDPDKAKILSGNMERIISRRSGS